jgi:hypothetical protein
MRSFANNEHGLADQWVKGVADRTLKRQTPGIMDPLRRMAELISPSFLVMAHLPAGRR